MNGRRYAMKTLIFPKGGLTVIHPASLTEKGNLEKGDPRVAV